ncbi:MAG: hypothetical protein AB1414_12400 [bacterium]
MVISINNIYAEIVNTATVSYKDLAKKESFGTTTAIIKVYTKVIEPGTSGIATSSDLKARLIIPAGVLPTIAYVRIDEYSYEDPKVREANEDAEKNSNLKPIYGNKSYDFIMDNAQGKSIGTLTGNVTISIAYSDINNDGKVDGTNIRVQTLKMFILKDNKWELVSNSKPDHAQKIVEANLNHVSIWFF